MKKKVPAWEPHHKANPLLGNTVANSTTWKQHLDSMATACDGEKVQKQVQQIQNTKNKVSAWGPHRKEFQKLRQFLDNKFDGLEQQIWILEEWTLAAPDEDDKKCNSIAFEGACIQMKMRMDDALQEMSECVQNIRRCSEEEWIKRHEDYYTEKG